MRGDVVADTAADTEMHMVADKEVDKVPDVVSDEKKKGTQFGKKKKKGYPIW